VLSTDSYNRRYRLLETIRTYAGERLPRTPNRPPVGAREAKRLAANLDDLTRARAARAIGKSATWLQPELVRPALLEALAPPPDEDLRGTVMRDLGTTVYDGAHAEGARLAPAEALRFTQSDEPDSAQPARQ
jgi:hypothetical protein